MFYSIIQKKKAEKIQLFFNQMDGKFDAAKTDLRR
jgi:hypothetical protein